MAGVRYRHQSPHAFLAAVSATDPAARNVWERYLSRWTMWNHVRTAAAMAAALLYTLGLMQNGAT